MEDRRLLAIAAALAGVISAALMASDPLLARGATARRDTPLPAPSRARSAWLARLPRPAGADTAGRAPSPSPVPRPSPARDDDAGVSPTPGPRVAPLPERTTVAPFPVPGDSAGESSARMRTLNVPRAGVTSGVPLPEGAVTAPEPTVVSFPEALTTAPPEYPEAAREAGVDGTVLVQLQVLADGRPGAMRVLRSVPGLDEAALACLRQWRFQPALDADGIPVAVWVGIPVRFTLHP